MIHDSGVMARSGIRSIWTELDRFPPLLVYDREAPEKRATSKGCFQSDLLRLGGECSWSLYRLLDEYLLQGCQDITLERHMKMSFSASGCICDISLPLLDCTADGDAEIIKSTNLRLLQIVGAAERFYSSSYGHCDTIIVVIATTESSHLNGHARYSCLFAKLRRLITVFDLLPNVSFYLPHSRLRFADCSHKPENELCFVQW